MDLPPVIDPIDYGCRSIQVVFEFIDRDQEAKYAKNYGWKEKGLLH